MRPMPKTPKTMMCAPMAAVQAMTMSDGTRGQRISSNAKSTPATGAPKAAASPATAPATT